MIVNRGVLASTAAASLAFALRVNVSEMSALLALERRPLMEGLRACTVYTGAQLIDALPPAGHPGDGQLVPLLTEFLRVGRALLAHLRALLDSLDEDSSVSTVLRAGPIAPMPRMGKDGYGAVVLGIVIMSHISCLQQALDKLETWFGAGADGPNAR